nr:PREDICTED: uncharacterized protein LOC107399131 [Tribolium castaneum]|eukprot:XP_015840320.1 PREDICTED: uncharacterized protein LOC107399131 [Tribolium castaneum]
MFLNLGTVFTYLNASPGSRCFVEGKAVLNAGHLISCGMIKEEELQESVKKWKIKAYCLQSSAIKSDRHQILGLLVANGTNSVNVDQIKCSCKAGVSGCCKHVAATLLFCTRKPIDEIPQLSYTDTECVWKNKRPRVEKQYEATPLHLTKCYATKVKHKNVANLSDTLTAKLLKDALQVVPNSKYSLQFKGRRR